MADDIKLSSGAIEQILQNQRPPNPIFQIIGYKLMTPDQLAFGTANEDSRYRLMIGDGVKAHQYCVITNQDLVEDFKCGRIDKWSIIRVTSYQTVDYGDGPPENKRRLIYILNLDLVKKGSEVGFKIQYQPEQIQNIVQPPQQQQQQQQPKEEVAYTQPHPYPIGSNQQARPMMRSSNEHQTIGIGELTPYIGKWVVKGRVTSKSAIREYTNAKGAGKLFNFTMADKTGEIKITGFNADCDRVYAYLEPNKVYVLGRAQVKSADKRYTTADYEITLNSDSLLEEVIDSRDTSDVPLAKFNFVSIATVANLPVTQPIDLIGAITNVGEPSTIVSRTKNKELKKREIIIVDMSRHDINVTIWGEQSESFTGVQGDIFVTKAARLSTYAGRSVSAGDCMFINPDIPEVRKIKNWYDKLLETNFTHVTQQQDSGSGGDQWKFLDQLMDKDLAKQIMSSGNQSNAYAKCKAVLMLVGRNPVYKCCPTDNCGKKLVDTQNNELKCEKCQQTFTTYRYRYKTDVEIVDSRGAAWVTLWDEKAEEVLGLKPDELEKLMKMENKDAYDAVLGAPTFKTYIFTLRVRLDTYNNEERVKLNVVNLKPLDVPTYAKRLMEEIKAY